MTDETIAPPPVEPQATVTANSVPRRKMFRRVYSTVKLQPDAADRQSRITMLAWKALGPECAKTFLNSYNDHLQGRPLDVAVASVGGIAAVERELSAIGSVGTA